MTLSPRFGHRVIPIEKIKTDEVQYFREASRKLKQSIQLHSLWQPLFVEVIKEDDQEYRLVDGFKRLKFVKETLNWTAVECIVTLPTSFEERQLRRLGMHTFTKTFSSYDTHCAIYALKQVGISDAKIMEFSGLSPTTTMRYLNNLWLPLRDVLEGQLHKAPYEGWTKVLSISSENLSSSNLSWLKRVVLTRQCNGYQLDGIIEAITTPQFQRKSQSEQLGLMQEMVLLTKNSRSSEMLTASELVGLKLPKPDKAVSITLKSVKLAEKLLQPYILYSMKSEQLLEVHTVAQNLKRRVESVWKTEDFKGNLHIDGPIIN